MSVSVVEPGVLPLEITRGEPLYLQVTCKTAQGAIVSLAGMTAVAVMRPENGSPNEFDLEPTIPAPATDGKILINLDGDNTRLKFPAGQYVWGMALNDATGNRIPEFLSGPVNVIDNPPRE